MAATKAATDWAAAGSAAEGWAAAGSVAGVARAVAGSVVVG